VAPARTGPFDIVIVGGGSAGCVLAARLSEQPSRRVALLEAGPDVPPSADQLSAYPGRAYFEPRTLWPGTVARLGGAHRNDTTTRPTAPYAQGRGLGGSSAINGLGANRGAPEDYDAWGRLGAEGWSWESVLPYFRKLERDLDRTGPLHGAGGPIPVRRPTRPTPAASFGVLPLRRWRRVFHGVPTRMGRGRMGFSRLRSTSMRTGSAFRRRRAI